MDEEFKASDIDSRLWGAMKTVEDSEELTKLADIQDKRQLIIDLLGSVNLDNTKFTITDLKDDVVGDKYDNDAKKEKLLKELKELINP